MAVRKGAATTTGGRGSLTAPEETVIRVSGLRKRYGEVIAVDAVNLDVHRGEVLGILGPGGAGKTTTLEMIEGRRDPDAGEIEIAGYDALRERDQMKGLIGVVSRMTAFPTPLKSALRPRQHLDIAAHAVETDLRMDGLSRAQRRRLWLALIDDPRILLLDDPTALMDSRERREFWRVVRRIRDAGTTVILATRRAEEAGELCDRVALMDRGRVLICDTPRALISSLDEEAVISVGVQRREDVARLEPNLNLLRGVLSCDLNSVEIRVRTDDAEATVAGLDNLASERGVNLAVLSVRRPDLEDAFVAYAAKGSERAGEPLGCVSPLRASRRGFRVR